MARTNNKIEDNKEIIENETQEPKQEELETVSKSDYDELKNEFDELKALLLESMKAKEIKKDEVVVGKNEVDNDELESPEMSIAPHTMINVTNLFYGQLFLQGVNKVIEFPTFGVTLPMTYEDVAHAQSQARSFAEQGYFYIHNKKAVKTLYLEDAYKNFIQKDKLVNIYKLSESQIKDIISHTTEGIKKTIVDMTIDTLVSDEKKDYEHKKIKDNSKVLLIGELLGTDLIKESKKLIES